MAFQDIKPIDSWKFYCDLALRRANAAAEQLRSKAFKGRFEKSKGIEMQKISIIRNTLHNKLTDIIRSFPDFDKLTQFYQELVKITIDYEMLMHSLGALTSARKKIVDLFIEYNRRFIRTKEQGKLNVLRREFAGRSFSVMKTIRKNLEFLEEARKILSDFPSIKHEMNKAAIAGFPNVGKSTLLTKISKSKPEIAAYAFTTKRLNIGYYEKYGKKIQLIDTPGTLNRLEKMNFIEKQAYVAMKYAADAIIYVFDLTEEYPLKDQVKLYDMIKEFRKPIIIYLSKTDITDKGILL